VLVTHRDGRQTVEEIKNDLGIRAGDTEAMLANLRAQGLDPVRITLSGGAA
jgi:calcyphosin